MKTVIALAGNPNSGKTTLFNLLTGATQYVGNWPGVTVEKKEGVLKKHRDVTIADLPGIYSLSPYSPEEVIARTYLCDARPQCIINIVDGTNLERNLYLTSQLSDMGLPMVVALNMADEVKKSGDKVDAALLSKKLGMPVIPISALKNEGVDELIDTALRLSQAGRAPAPQKLSDPVERALSETQDSVLRHAQIAPDLQRWYAVKLLENDEKALDALPLSEDLRKQAAAVRAALEQKEGENAESVITQSRYEAISDIMRGVLVRKNKTKLTRSDKIDRVVTNRFLALPIFAVVMTLVYYIAISTVGTAATDWVNEGVFGDGFFWLGRGRAQYEEKAEEFKTADAKVQAFLEKAKEQGLDPESPTFAEDAKNLVAEARLVGEDEITTEKVDFAAYAEAKKIEEPDVNDFGRWVRGIPAVVEEALDRANASPWLKSLILNGIIAGVGAVLGFVPQILVLFFLLAILEGCGYMARIAFIMDRIFRRFGLSGKSFIPMLIGSGCSIPAIMASRTIENPRDRRMTITTTSFIPCSAKLPVIAMIAGALFAKAWWVTPLCYFTGVAAIVLSGIILKKTARFRGEPSPFVMELPPYRIPTAGAVLRSMWERGWSFIKKAGTVILLAAIFIWLISSFGVKDGRFRMLEAIEIDHSLAAVIGRAVGWLFAPLGFGDWQSAVATLMGLVAKENVVNTFGIVFGFEELASEAGVEIWEILRSHYAPIAGLSLLMFNLLCAPCFAAIGAIKREMNSGRWTLFAILYQTVFAYAVSLMVYRFGLLFAGQGFTLWTAAAIAVFAGMLYLLLRKDPEKALKR